MIQRIRELVRRCLPFDAVALVVSRGDPELLHLYGREVRHFPQTNDGTYSGFSPACTSGVIAHLEALRAQGATFLILPHTEIWWLDYYKGLRHYLEVHYKVVANEENTALIFSLAGIHGREGAPALLGFEEIIAEFEDRFGNTPAILDWTCGFNLETRFQRFTIFSPLRSNGALPYDDRSVDMVALSSTEPDVLAEAYRVAQAAVVVLSNTPSGSISVQKVDWLMEQNVATGPTVSIIIPCYNGITTTEACLAALLETLPDPFGGEIILVDDASTDQTQKRLAELAEADRRLTVLRNERNLGFIQTCNRGAAAATGDILVFLNNDTIPLHNWLAPLLRIFAVYPDAGAVGGKLVFPDGRLQEAGSVIFADGSGANFGKGDYDLDAPLYNYVREVDYCSGALLATPRTLFSQLGGFDTRYQPAYYEDTDYCFTVREHGHRVYYQPESVVVHVEGASSGTDESSGVKKFQGINRSKFVTKWEVTLRQQPAPPAHYDSATWQALASRTSSVGGNTYEH